MKTDFDPSHYRFDRTLPHSGNAIEGPQPGENLRGAFWRCVGVIVMLVGLLMLVEAWR